MEVSMGRGGVHMGWGGMNGVGGWVGVNRVGWGLGADGPHSLYCRCIAREIGASHFEDCVV
jgi:hypothetical protein